MKDPQPAAPWLAAASSLLTPRACRWAAVLFFALLLVVGAVPGKAEALSAMVYDKLLHFLAYAVLSALIYGSLPGAPLARTVRTLLVVGLLGALDEVLQSLLSYRNASWFDWQVDMMAAIVTVTVLSFLHARNAASDMQ